MYSLKRIKPEDGKGISGARIITMVRPTDDEDNPERDTETQYPKVGWRMLIESFARWYVTSTITKIVEETEDEESVIVVFETENSTYELRKFK
jgi:hypothetical protein